MNSQGNVRVVDELHNGNGSSEHERQVVLPLHQLEKSFGLADENMPSSKNWRKSNLFLEIPTRTLEVSRPEFLQTKMPLTQAPTPKRVSFALTPSPSSSRPSSTRAKSSVRNILPKLNFKQHVSNPDTDKATTLEDKLSILSFSRMFTPRMKTTSSLPVTPVGRLNPDSGRDGSTSCLSTPDTKVICRMSRSLSVPALNKERGEQKADSYFRVIPSTPKVKDEDEDILKTTTEDDENNVADGEDIPKEEAVCRICLLKLCEGGETLKMECSCRGELALAHHKCAVKWFSIKGNKMCDVCKQQVENLPVTLLRIQSSINHNLRMSNGQTGINGYRVWQDVPILIVISMLGYFCFLEQLLVGKMGSSAIVISLPFSCVLGLLASMTSSTMVKKRYVWVYAFVQFALVVLFAHIFYSMVRDSFQVHIQAVLTILLSTMMGFGGSMGLNSVLLEVLRRARRTQAIGNQDEIRIMTDPSQQIMSGQVATPPYGSPRHDDSDVENPETFGGR